MIQELRGADFAILHAFRSAGTNLDFKQLSDATPWLTRRQLRTRLTALVDDGFLRVVDTKLGLTQLGFDAVTGVARG